MSKRKQATVRVINPKASTVRTTTDMPYSSVPLTTSPGDAVRPLTTPRLRQIVESESVHIVNPRAL